MIVHLLVNGELLTSHRSPEEAGERLAGYYVDGPTPFTALLYVDGRPALKDLGGPFDAALTTAAEAVLARRGKT